MYEIFELTKSATHLDIKKAYYRLALKCHPDKNGGDDTAFKKL
jgi:curved DNA-binding protein CbpA